AACAVFVGAMTAGAAYGWLWGKEVGDSKNVWASPGWQTAIFYALLFLLIAWPAAAFAGIASAYASARRLGATAWQQRLLGIAFVGGSVVFGWWILHWVLGVV